MEGFKTFTADQLDIFSNPARIIIGGCSHSGKTTICSKLITRNANKFDRVVISSINRDSFELPKEISDTVLYYDDVINPFDEILYKGYKLLYIIDDLYQSAFNSRYIADAFTKGRHEHISVILITQNIFPRNVKFARDITLNSTHFILCKQRDLNQPEILMRQIFGKKYAAKLIDVFAKHLRSNPFGYILIDLSPSTPYDLQIRTNIFKENNGFETVFQV